MSEDIAAAMAQAMSTENRRRELAAQTPGLGAPMALADLPYHSHGLGPAVGEGYQVTAQVAPEVHKAYGEARPVYGAPEVGGLGYAPVDARPALRSRLYELADRVFTAQDARAAAGNAVVISPETAPRRSLLGRMLGRLRRR